MTIEQDLDLIAVQERELQWSAFDADLAWNLGTRLKALASERGHAVVIDVRRFGQPLFYCALSGTTPDNVEWVRRKSNVVARFLRSSYGVGLTLKRDGTTLLEKFGLRADNYAAHGGSFPITVVQAGVIGSVTVSGLPQRADHEMVVEALSAELGHEYPTMALPAPQ